MVTLTTRIMFLLFTCMHLILRRYSVCASSASEVVHDCQKFEKHCSMETWVFLWNFTYMYKPNSAIINMEEKEKEGRRRKDWKQEVCSSYLALQLLPLRLLFDMCCHAGIVLVKLMVTAAVVSEQRASCPTALCFPMFNRYFRNVFINV
jgi:hypothetical protein